MSSPSPVGLGWASCLEVMYGLASSSGSQSARPVRKGRLLFRGRGPPLLFSLIVQPASPCWWWHPGRAVGSRHCKRTSSDDFRCKAKVHLQIVSLYGVLDSCDASQAPEVRTALARLLERLLQHGSSAGEGGVRVDRLQHLHSVRQPVVVRRHSVRVEPLLELVVQNSNTVPVEAAVAASGPILVLQTVVESQTENFGCVVATSIVSLYRGAKN